MWATLACGVSRGAVRNAESFFFPLDDRLRLGTEGYSPALLAKAVRQARKASSFEDASDDLRELAGVEISATHLQRLSERIGREWAKARDEEVEKFGTVKYQSQDSVVIRGLRGAFGSRDVFGGGCSGDLGL